MVVRWFRSECEQNASGSPPWPYLKVSLETTLFGHLSQNPGNKHHVLMFWSHINDFEL